MTNFGFLKNIAEYAMFSAAAIEAFFNVSAFSSTCLTADFDLSVCSTKAANWSINFLGGIGTLTDASNGKEI